MDNISSEQISYRKKVGTLDGNSVIELATKGGLHLIVMAKLGKVETIGTGPHRAVARHIALKRHPGIKWSDLNKSDYVDVVHFSPVLPKYEALTLAFRKAEGSE